MLVESVLKTPKDVHERQEFVSPEEILIETLISFERGSKNTGSHVSLCGQARKMK